MGGAKKRRGKERSKKRATAALQAPAAQQAPAGPSVAPGSDPLEQLVRLKLHYSLLGKSEWWWIFDDSLEAVSAALQRDNCVVLDGFLGTQNSAAFYAEIRAAYLAGRLPETKHSMVGCPRMEPGSLAGGTSGANLSYQLEKVRGDYVAWFSGREDACRWKVLPVFLQRADTLVSELGSKFLPELSGVSNRSNAMMSCYPGDGAHYVRHCDNTNLVRNGRKLTVLYYANPDWSVGDGGELRCYEPAGQLTGKLVSTKQKRDIAPLADRLVLFWSDTRVPHEVLPTQKRRFAVTTWYFDDDERAQAVAKEDDPVRAERERLRIEREIKGFEQRTGQKAKTFFKQNEEEASAGGVRGDKEATNNSPPPQETKDAQSVDATGSAARPTPDSHASSSEAPKAPAKPAPLPRIQPPPPENQGHDIMWELD